MTPEQKLAVEHLGELTQLMIDFLRDLAAAKPGDTEEARRLGVRWLGIGVQFMILDVRTMTTIPTLADAQGREDWRKLTGGKYDHT